MASGQNASQSNLWVGSLPEEWTDAELREKFQPFGDVKSVKVLVDPATKASRGCGFVNFSKPEEASAAIEGTADSGLVVKIATDQKSNDWNKGKGKGETKKDNLYIMGLPVDCEHGLVGDLFKSFNVIRSKYMPKPSEGASETHAMVQLASEEEAAAAMEKYNGKPVEGIELPRGVLTIRWVGCFPGGESGKGAAPAVPTPVSKSTGRMSITIRYTGQDGTQASDSLYLLGLPTPQLDDTTLRMLFTNIGLTVKRAKALPASGDHGNSAALVQVGSEEEAAKAIAELNGKVTTCEEVRAAGGLTEDANLLTVNFAGKEQTPSDNIFITGLPSPKVDEDWLREIIQACGCTVSQMKIMPDTKGLGYSQALVRLESQEQAETIIAMLNGEQCPTQEAVAKNKLAVRYSGDGEPSAGIYISGLPSPQVDIESLKEVFAMLELVVEKCKPIPDYKGFGSSCALVTLPSQEDAEKAIGLFNGEVCTDFRAATSGSNTWSKPAPPVKVVYAGSDDTPSDNLYISNLPSPGTTDAALAQLIKGVGCTYKRSKIIPDTKGWGCCAAMIQVGSMEEAAALIEELNGQTLSNEDMKGLDPNGASGTVTAQPQVAAGVRNGSATISVQFAGKGNPPSDNLYIAGLPTTVTEEVLKGLFGGLGMTVNQAKIIPDTKGFGSCVAMVRLASMEEATQAIKNLHGESFSVEDFNKFITSGAGELPSWSTAAPAKSAVGGSKLLVRYGGNAEAVSANLFVGGLPSTADDSIVKKLIERLGVKVERLKVLPDTKNTGTLSAMVKVSDEYEAAQCIEQLNGESFPEDLMGDSSSQWKPTPATPQWNTQWTTPAKPQWTPQMTPPEMTPPSNGAPKNAWTGGSNASDEIKVVYGGKQQTPSANLYVSNLPAPETTEIKLRSIFEGAGLTVKRMKVNADTRGLGKCTALVEVASQEEAANAIYWFSGKTLEAASEGASSWSGGQNASWEEPPEKKAKVEKKAAPAKAAPAEAPAMSVRYAGKKGADGTAPPSDYIVLSGFPGALPSEDDVKGVLCGFNVDLKRMRSMNNQLMVQVGSVAEATKAIENLDQWPWPVAEEAWPEC
jgi:RNA recognition motif-containing protein